MNIISDIRTTLKENSDEKTRLSSLRFFKENETIHTYGVKTALVTQISKESFKLIKDRSKEEIFDLCETLWQSIHLEELFIACNWSYYVHKTYESKDFERFESWVKQYINNWATCDTLCNHTIGTFVEMYPNYVSSLKKWAISDNRWERRAAAVTLIIPARKGLFLNEIFNIADILLLDKDDMVQKGYGWMLKVASEAHQKEVFDYVVSHKKVMPRTALRYAIEKMPEDLRAIAMKK